MALTRRPENEEAQFSFVFDPHLNFKNVAGNRKTHRAEFDGVFGGSYETGGTRVFRSPHQSIDGFLRICVMICERLFEDQLVTIMAQMLEEGLRITYGTEGDAGVFERRCVMYTM